MIVDRGPEVPAVHREPVALTPYQTGKAVRDGLRDIRSLSKLKGFSSVVLPIPKTLDSWLIEPTIDGGNGMRLRKFNAHDGTIEMLSLRNRIRRKITDESDKPSTIPAQLLWQDLIGDAPQQLNTDIGAERLDSAVRDIISLLEPGRIEQDEGAGYT